jgi:hypothetical protein
MNVLLVVMLVGLWVWLLSPGVLRERRPRSVIPSIDSFERYMDTLAPLSEQPLPSDRPGVRRSIQVPPHVLAAQRRQRLFSRLAIAVPPALLVGVLFGGWAWIVPLVVIILFVAYTTALVVHRRRRELQARVARLPEADSSAAEAEQRRRAQEA